MRATISSALNTLQDTICATLEVLDGRCHFREDLWSHPAGSGRTRVLQDGGLFERAGVNTSAVETDLPEGLARRLHVDPQRAFATGISLVLHPASPMVPTVHANFRYIELANGDFWFSGGADLTPWYLVERDAAQFHMTWKHVCDRHDLSWYPKFKKGCDEYFFLKHRGETRGIGGIFFDDLRGDRELLWHFVQDCGNSFLQSYVPIVERRRHDVWSERERSWQLLRRGRYVEFNLLYDRATAFGLETDGRAESVLISLPPLVRWDYQADPQPGSREAVLVAALRSPREWINTAPVISHAGG